MKRFFAVLFIACTPSLIAQSPQPQAAAPYVETFDVQVNNVDVVVADKRGKPVAGLRQEDFIVLEDGVPQPLSNFSEYNATASVRADSASAAGDSVQAPSTRKLVFIVDSMSLHPYTRRTLQREMGEFIANMMRGGDEAMIVMPDARDNQVRLPFTADAARVRQALDETIEKNHFRADTAYLNEQRFYEAGQTDDVRSVTGVLGRVYADMTERRVWKTLSHLDSVVSALAEVPGKKTVILMTESLPAIAGADQYGMFGTFVGDYRLPLTWGRDLFDLRPMLGDIARTASSNGIAIYCLQPQYGFEYASPGGDISRRGSAGNVNANYRLFNARLDATQASLEILTDRTGGRWMRGESRVDNFFNGIESDLSSYYSLGYHPTSAVQDKARKIEVRLRNHPELSVRARRDVVRKSPGEEMNDLVVASLLYPKNVDELSVNATAGQPHREKGAWLVPVDVHIPIASLTLLPDGSKYRGSFSVHYAAAAQKGDFSAGVDRSQVVEVPADEIAKAREQYFTYSTNLKVPDGKVNIAVGVLDPVSRLSSFKKLEVVAR